MGGDCVLPPLCKDGSNTGGFGFGARAGLLEQKFSSASDVWSFGITCVEIFQDGLGPYPETRSNPAIMAMVTDGWCHYFCPSPSPPLPPLVSSVTPAAPWRVCAGAAHTNCSLASLRAPVERVHVKTVAHVGDSTGQHKEGLTLLARLPLDLCNIRSEAPTASGHEQCDLESGVRVLPLGRQPAASTRARIKTPHQAFFIGMRTVPI